MNEDGKALLELVRPLAACLKVVPLEDATAAAAEIERLAPFSGPLVKGIREALFAAADADWLCNKQVGELRFGRLAKDLGGFSVDAVLMASPGPRHRHPRGEIDLCFRREGTPEFDGHPEGWVVYGPGSEHVPTVSGGSMLILYFLPGGAIEW